MLKPGNSPTSIIRLLEVSVQTVVDSNVRIALLVLVYVDGTEGEREGEV